MLLLNEMPKVIYDGMTMTGSEYKALSFRNLLSYKWPETVLTSIASMFRYKIKTNAYTSQSERSS